MGAIGGGRKRYMLRAPYGKHKLPKVARMLVCPIAPRESERAIGYQLMSPRSAFRMEASTFTFIEDLGRAAVFVIGAPVR